MNILFSSHRFAPSIGGIETVSALLATQFTRQGHSVKLITETCERDSQSWLFPIYRRPSATELLSMTRWCDVFFHNNISLRAAWPLLFLPRPWLIAHQTWITRPDQTLGWHDSVKRLLLKAGTNISISKAIADTLPVPSVIIGNPYQDDIFRSGLSAIREGELIFVGRLVSDKGVDLLIHALSMLKLQGILPRLTVVGSGPEENGLKGLSDELQLNDQIRFVGPQTGKALVEFLNIHTILVVPSRWREPFGIVALEGIACGCVVVGSSDGGLPEAIGPCGITFENGNAQALARALRTVLTDQALLQRRRDSAPSHLRNFTTSVVAQKYLELFEGALR